MGQKPRKLPQQSNNNITQILPEYLLDDLRHMIDEAHQFVASTINTKLTMLYWQIGQRIIKETLQGKRAEYGQSIVVTVSRQLVMDYGVGFNEKNIRRMIQFAEIFSNE